MNVFKIIGQILLGETEDRNTTDRVISDSSNGGQQENKSIPDAIDSRLKIKKSTLALLDSLYLMDSEKCKSKRIVVWFDTDNTTYNAYSGFEQDLKEFWSVESGYVFEDVILKLGTPERDGRKVNIESLDIYLQEKTDTTYDGPIVKKASISIFGNKGSLLNDATYELSSEILEKEHRKFYNIGRGEFPDMGGSGYRQNHIVIDDKNNLESNRYVSRAHARIGYSDNIGFYLQVEYGGSRLSGNRTRIFRGEGKTIEVENVDVKEPLLNGDLIELGKAVVLQFVESN